jgi:hypothetical protein
MPLGIAPDGYGANEKSGNGCVLFLKIKLLTGTKRTTKYSWQHLDSTHGLSDWNIHDTSRYSEWNAAAKFQTKSISMVERNNRSLASSHGSVAPMEASFLFQRTKRTKSTVAPTTAPTDLIQRRNMEL